MNDGRMPDAARDWARSVRGSGAALSGPLLSLDRQKIRLDRALLRSQVRGRSLWSAGLRLRQAQRMRPRAPGGH